MLKLIFVLLWGLVWEDEALATVVSWSHSTFYRVATVAETPLCPSFQNPVVFTWTEVLEERDPRTVATPFNLEFKVRHQAQSFDEIWQVLFPRMPFTAMLIFYEVFKSLFISNKTGQFISAVSESCRHRSTLLIFFLAITGTHNSLKFMWFK